MSHPLFSLLAAIVTVGGLLGVIGGVYLSQRFVAASRIKAMAGFLCLIYMGVIFLRPSSWLVIDLSLFAGAIGGVLLIKNGFQTPGAVVVFLAVASVFDIISMSAGISHVLVERYRNGQGDLLIYLSLLAPIRGRAVPIVGIGDLIVGGAATTALLGFGIGRFSVMGTMAGGLLAALAYGLWRGGTPALPFIAVAVSILVWWYSRMSRFEKGNRITEWQIKWLTGNKRSPESIGEFLKHPRPATQSETSSDKEQ